jgi:site-specific DNA-methyltransferase (cytosine-N4-specific)
LTSRAAIIKNATFRREEHVPKPVSGVSPVSQIQHATIDSGPLTGLINPDSRSYAFNSYYVRDSVELLSGSLGRQLKGTVQLLLTSPPFPLNDKKRYGNKVGKEYLEWFSHLATIWSPLLTPTGSIVVELGNAWEPGRPVQSLLPLKAMLGFVEAPDADLRLCQEFVCHNPARLPTPAQWVTVEHIRAIDSFTHIWWMSRSDKPKSNTRQVLRPYSSSMKELLARGTYDAGKRPSGHTIGKTSFLKDNGGSLPHNVLGVDPEDPQDAISLLSASNTASTDYFSRRCRELGLTPHPARMSSKLAEFFIRFLTEPGDLVLDPFAGSNTTGACAQKLGRNWISIEIDPEYKRQADIRLENLERCDRAVVGGGTHGNS